MRKLTLLILIGLHTSFAMACKCSPESFKQAYKSSQIIYAVKVLEILPPSQLSENIATDGTKVTEIPANGYAKKVVITKLYKGNTMSDTLIIAEDPSNCELYMELGKSYLIYGNIQNNKIYTNKCTRSGKLENHQDITLLEKKIRRKKKK